MKLITSIKVQDARLIIGNEKTLDFGVNYFVNKHIREQY